MRYFSRPIISLIRTNLYLANAAAATEERFLSRHDIARILSVTEIADHRPQPEFCRELGIEQKIFPITDNTGFADTHLTLANEIFPWIKEAEERRIPLVVQCHAAISRSPALVIAYVMQGIGGDENLAFGAALELVTHQHMIAAPNPTTLRSFLNAIGFELPAYYYDIFPGLREVANEFYL